jgi:hypothetical protein
LPLASANGIENSNQNWAHSSQSFSKTQLFQLNSKKN